METYVVSALPDNKHHQKLFYFLIFIKYVVLVKKCETNRGFMMNTYIGCSVIIHDENNKVLIAQRSKNKKSFPLLWETVGGALEENEIPEDCIRREVQEEINCHIHDLKLFKVYVINNNDRFVLVVYTGRIIEPIQPNPEIEQIRWIDKSEIDNFDFYGNECKKLLDYYDQA